MLARPRSRWPKNGEFLLESAGVELIAENGGGPGWLKKVKAEG